MSDPDDISSSPDRGSFQLEKYIQRQTENDKPVNEAYVELFKTMRQLAADQLNDPEWKINNLEYDLRSTQWILDKAHASEGYAQNIYAALCNMRWQRRDVITILKDEYWSCSWRSAGGIVADMLGSGDYINWYCSGMGGLASYDYQEGQKHMDDQGYVPEGTVTQEIQDDFYRLGWVPSDWPDDMSI